MARSKSFQRVTASWTEHCGRGVIIIILKLEIGDANRVEVTVLQQYLCVKYVLHK